MRDRLVQRIRASRLARGSWGLFLANSGARVGALVALAVATMFVAWATGPAGVGVYTLARVLPGLVGVVVAAGLPGAIAFFLAGDDRSDRRVPLTIVAIALAGGVAGTLLWIGASPLLRQLFFRSVPLELVLLVGGTVFTQLLVATAKSCAQGS